jgi:hypothetical protein
MEKPKILEQFQKHKRWFVREGEDGKGKVLIEGVSESAAKRFIQKNKLTRAYRTGTIRCGYQMSAEYEKAEAEYYGWDKPDTKQVKRCTAKKRGEANAV